MLKKNDSSDLAVYVVWSSQLGAKEKHVAEAAELMPDSRASHYWDENRRIGESLQDFFDLESPAWDVWMLFDREVLWEQPEPPEPSWWSHQLTKLLPRERRLDPKRFAVKAAELLAP